MTVRGAIAVLGCAAAAVGMSAPAQAALTFGSTVAGGPEEVVYDYDCVFPAPPPGACAAGGGAGVNACNRLNYPDVPVKAFRYRNNSGAERIQITMGSNTQNRRLVGLSLDSVVPERLSSEEQRTCGQDITFRAHADVLDPSRYQGQEYITAPYVSDYPTFPNADPADFGKKVFGFFHEEFHGGAAPANQFCDAAHSASEAENCWMSATVFNVSTDGGRCYAPIVVSGNTCVFIPAESRPPSQRITSLPDRYANNWGHRGLGAPTNVVYDPAHDYFYFFVRSPAIDPASPAPWSDEVMPAYRDQQLGECLVRTHDISDPSSWRAWDGEGNSAWDADGFSVRFIDPYTEAELPARHRCQPVAADVIGSLTTSLTFNTYFGKYMLIGLLRYDVGTYDQALYYSVSSNLIDWSQPQALADDDEGCAGAYPIVYPSILDADDPASVPAASGPRNFDHPDQSAFLYYSRTCRGASVPDNDLVRAPITFTGSPGDSRYAPVSKRYMQGERVNFQPWGSKRPPGYNCASPGDPDPPHGACDSRGLGIADQTDRIGRIDGGSAFDRGRGYGWVEAGTGTPLNMTPNMVDRHNLEQNVSQEGDTFAYMNLPDAGALPAADMERAAGAWEMAVPTGKYVVSASIGDPAGTTGQPGLRAEDATVISPRAIAAPDVYAYGFTVIDVCDGRLTIREHANASGNDTKLNWVDSYRVADATTC